MECFPLIMSKKLEVDVRRGKKEKIYFWRPPIYNCYAYFSIFKLFFLFVAYPIFSYRFFSSLLAFLLFFPLIRIIDVQFDGLNNFSNHVLTLLE